MKKKILHYLNKSNRANALISIDLMNKEILTN
jgi:hypothetical protein